MAKKQKVSKSAPEDVKEFDLVENKVIEEIPTEEFAPTKVTKLSPFKIIEMMFTDEAGFNNLTDAALTQAYFMINRTFAIQFPLQANFFNKMGVNQAEVLRFWQKFLTLKLGKGSVPRFVYTSGAKKTAESQKTDVKLDKATIAEYCKKYNISLRDFDDMMEFYKERTIEDVQRYEKLMSKSEQNKMFSKSKGSSKHTDE